MTEKVLKTNGMKSQVGILSITLYIVALQFIAFVPYYFKGDLNATKQYIVGIWMFLLVFGFFCFKVIRINHRQLIIYSIFNPFRFKRIFDLSIIQKIEARRMTTPEVLIIHTTDKKIEIPMALVKREFKNLVRMLQESNIPVDVVAFNSY